MRNLNEHNITEAALARLAHTPDPRLREIMSSLVTHLHAFAKEVRLTEDEWLHGIQFLTAVGHKTDEKRQEFILLSDTLGLSMLTVCMNNAKPPGCTETTVFGPFHIDNPPEFPLGADVANGAKGRPCQVAGRIVGLGGEVVPHARINIWQADEEGLYDVQRPELEGSQARALMFSNSEGHYHFKTIVAEAYPIPTDGPVGDMLLATKTHPWRPAHLHFKISAPGYETLITHVFRDHDQYLDSDVVFGVRQSLIADWKELADGSFTLNFDFVLNPK
jgi:hydroxyquinol 1,2-dioxygenase